MSYNDNNNKNITRNEAGNKWTLYFWVCFSAHRYVLLFVGLSQKKTTTTNSNT